MISGDVITDVDLTKIVAAPRRPRRDGHHRAHPRRQPARVRHRHHPRGRRRSSASSRSPRGARSSATRSTPASTCSIRPCSTTSSRAARSTSPARCSRSCWPTDKLVYGAIADGYWEDVGTLDAYLSAHKDVLDQRVLLDIPGFRISRRRLARRGCRGVARRASCSGPAVIGPGCKVEAGCRIGEYVVLGSNVRVLGGADFERSVVHDNVLHRPGARIRGTVIGRASNLRANVRVRGRRRARRRGASSARTPCSATTSRCTRSRRSRTAPSSTPRSSGRAAAPDRCSAATASTASPTSTSPRSWRPRWPWPTARACARAAPW